MPPKTYTVPLIDFWVAPKAGNPRPGLLYTGSHVSLLA